jgi:hypothetical protein
LFRCWKLFTGDVSDIFKVKGTGDNTLCMRCAANAITIVAFGDLVGRFMAAIDLLLSDSARAAPVE